MTSFFKITNPWPVAIVVYFICFISCIVGFVVFAFHNSMDLVSPDYYKQEILFQTQMERMTLGRSVASEINMIQDSPGDQLKLQMPVSHAGRIESGIIQFYRPSDASLDLVLPMELSPAGSQAVDISNFKRGLWKVKLQWLFEGKEFFLDRTLLLSGPESIRGG